MKAVQRELDMASILQDDVRTKLEIYRISADSA